MKVRMNFQLLLYVLFAIIISACGISPQEGSGAEPTPKGEEPALLDEDLSGSDDELLADALRSLQDELGAEGCTYNLYIMGWVMDWADAGNIIDTVFGPDSDFHYTFWELSYPDLADKFREIAYKAYREVDFEDRARLWGEAENILVDDVVMVLPMFYSEDITLYNTDVSYYLPPFGAPRFSSWSSKSGATTLVMPAKGDPLSLDTTLSWSAEIIYQLVDSPYTFTEEGSIEPLAATGFDVSEDGTVYTVHLREDALWSDGEPVLAQHFVDGILRLLDPSIAADYAYVMMGIEGAAEYVSGEADSLDSVTVIDDYTFQFTLSEPLAYFDSLLAFSTFQPVRLDLIEAFPDSYTRPGVIVSNGAYVLKEYVIGSHLMLEKNPLYWNAENVSYERIEIPIIPEPATCLAAFESGDIDATSCGFPLGEIPRWVDRPEFVRVPKPGMYYLGINTLADHTDDPDFRKALNYALDRRIINDVILDSPWKIEARGIISPEIYGYQGDAVGFDFDTGIAREHLAQYMTREGIHDSSEIVLEVWISSGWEDVVEAYQVMWEENLGIDVSFIPMEWKTYIDVLDTCKGIGMQDQ